MRDERTGATVVDVEGGVVAAVDPLTGKPSRHYQAFIPAGAFAAPIVFTRVPVADPASLSPPGPDLWFAKINPKAACPPASCAIHPKAASCEPPPLALGWHTITASVKDTAGSYSGPAGTGDVELEILAGAVADGTEIRLTVSSPQGLIFPVPLGWSVLLAVDLQASAAAGTSKHLRVPFDLARRLLTRVMSAANFVEAAIVIRLRRKTKAADSSTHSSGARELRSRALTRRLITWRRHRRAQRQVCIRNVAP
jgi:hypothetical protein